MAPDHAPHQSTALSVQPNHAYEPAGESSDRLREHAQRNLSALVIAIEFTLISVMVGVILFPLMDFATALLRDMRFEYWLYILSGLLFILSLWAIVISHSLSFVGWPIDIGRNLLYIVFAMVLAIQMHFLSDPQGWFAMTVLSSAVGALTAIYDKRVIEQRLNRAGQAAERLYSSALAGQTNLVRLTPLFVLSPLVALAFIVVLPEVFLQARGHLVLVVAQIIILLVSLRRVIRGFKSWTEPIVRKTVEELQSEQRAQ